MTTREPGAMLVFTYGLTDRPRSTAFLATRPAATITDGLEVFVQLVMAAMTTEPLPISARPSPVSTSTAVADGLSATATPPAGSAPGLDEPEPSNLPGKAERKFSRTPDSATRSCGRLGPARLGSTVDRSSSRTSENSGTGISSVRKSPCALQ